MRYWATEPPVPLFKWTTALFPVTWTHIYSILTSAAVCVWTLETWAVCSQFTLNTTVIAFTKTGAGKHCKP